MSKELPTFEQALTELMNLACSCDLMNGWICPAHEVANEVRGAQAREIKAAVDRLFEHGQ